MLDAAMGKTTNDCDFQANPLSVNDLDLTTHYYQKMS